MALDKANNRLFVEHHGNSRYDIYQLDDDGLPLRRHADLGIGRSLIGRGFAFAPMNTTALTNPGGASFDSVHQRMFVSDDLSLGPPAARILVFDLSPETLATLERNELPQAIAVLGQPDFETYEPGAGPAKIGSRGTAVVDEERQLLFFTDPQNNRVLVWDIDPDRLVSGMDAMAVIGQPDLNTNEPGIGRRGLARPSGMVYDPRRQNLFVGDGNNRVMVFHVSDQNLAEGGDLEAFAAIGQADFDSREPRETLRKYGGGSLGLDYEYHRLFAGEFAGNRVLVFDVSPANLEGASNPDAVAVLGQPDFESTDPAVSQTRLTMPRVDIDTERQLAYVPDGYPAGNRVNIFDIHPERMQQTLTPMLEQLGHINPEGEPDFLARSPNDRISPRYWTQGRDIAVDRLDHRLFMSDNYGHRVMIFQLDRMNRLLERGASWVLGQEDTSTSVLLPGRDATTIKLPMSVEYDEVHKRLFVGDTWNDRVLVFDMTPGQVESGMPASHVLGQKDFTSYEPAATRNRIFFGSRNGNGIGRVGSRSAELTLDETTQRLYVTDGGNHRVLVFDVDPHRLRNGADAIAVLGQENFTSTEEGLSAARWRLPGDLVVDEINQRLFVGISTQHRILVFDVHPDRLRNGQAASAVIGQPRFDTRETGLSGRMLREPDGLSYDSANHRLYVSDKRNQRVLVFDAHPDRLGNFPAAIGVLGEPDFDHMRVGPGDPRNYPDRLHDPRGSYFDATDQRLYQSEGLNGRMTVFTLPREAYRVDLPGRSNLRYASLDAQLSTGPQPLESGYSTARLSNPGKLAALSTHLVTRAVMHEQSERQSRELISQAVLAASVPVRSGLLYVDGRSGRDTAVSLVNGHSSPMEVRLELSLLNGDRLQRSVRLETRGQVFERVSALFPRLQDPHGVLRIEADEPLSMSGLLEIPDGAGHTMLSPAPLISGETDLSGLAAERRVLPVLTTGAGQHVDYILMNGSDRTVRGELAVTAQAPVNYEIDAGGIFIHESPSAAEPLLTGHGLVRPSEGAAPAAFAVVTSSRRGGSVRSVHTVTSHQEGTLFWAPVDTYPDILHHGNINAELSIVNEGLVPATIYLELFDIDGQSTATYERTVPLGERAMLSLEEVFGRSPLRGTLRIFSDTAVTVTLLETTVTVDNEAVITDVPLQETPQQARTEIVFPLFQNGEGHATELMLVNTDQRNHGGSLSVMSSAGEPRAMILR